MEEKHFFIGVYNISIVLKTRISFYIAESVSKGIDWDKEDGEEEDDDWDKMFDDDGECLDPSAMDEVCVSLVLASE